MRRIIRFVVILFMVPAVNCTDRNKAPAIQHHRDNPFIQDYSVKYLVTDESTGLYTVASDRDGYIQIFSSAGLMRPAGGQFLFPGRIVKDIQYLPTSEKKIAGIGTYREQLVYVDDKAVLSNAWAGKLYSMHPLTGARIFAGGKDFDIPCFRW